MVLKKYLIPGGVSADERQNPVVVLTKADRKGTFAVEFWCCFLTTGNLGFDFAGRTRPKPRCLVVA